MSQGHRTHLRKHGQGKIGHVITLTAGAHTDRGRVRSENQDFLGRFPEESLNASLPKGQLFVVADGMGGHKGGREASELAVRTLAAHYSTAPTKDILESLKSAFEAANSTVYQKSTSGTEFAGMGTTCTALVLKDGQAVIGHIGDSRVYRINRSAVVQLTNDHSRVADLVRRAVITKEQARIHPERSQLYRALGTRPVVEVDYISGIRLPRDCYFLLCTDGLFNHVTEDEMQSIVLAKPPAEACTALVDLANERGGTDNITVQVIHSVSGEGKFNKLLRKRRR